MCFKYYRFSSKEAAKLFVNEGLIYFNSLNYYKKYPEENNAIKDLNEGSIKLSIPKNNLEIIFNEQVIKNDEISSQNIIIKKELKELENFFIFCLSNKYSEIMYSKFNANTCVEIKNIDELFRRIQKTLPENYNLYFDDVEYYDPKILIKNKKPLCLYKSQEYKYQSESRFYIHVPYIEETKCKANFKDIGQYKNLIMHLKLQKLQCIELKLGDLSDICHIINIES